MTRSILPVLLFVCFGAFAQQRISTDKAVAQLAENYNTGQYAAIYNQFTPQSKTIVTEESIIQFYKSNILPPLGLITSWKYIDEVKTNANYIVNFQRGKMALKIAVSKDLHITYSEWFAVKPEKEIPNPKNPALIKTTNPRQTKLQLYLDTLALNYLKDPNNSSLSIGIANGNTSETYYYGETKKETNTLPNDKSLYEIGSITKTFTAILLSHAVNEKKITLNDDIRKYLPGNYPDLQFKNEPIRIVHLANHTSGLPGLPLDFNTSSGYDASNPYLHYSKEMIYGYLKTFRPDTVAGARSQYSNFAFAILGTILENVYHKSLEDLIKQTITGPLKMNNTNFDVPENEKNLLTTGYSEESGKAVSYWQFGAFRAAGGLKSNMQDMMIYLRANMNNLNVDFSMSHKETDRQADFSRGLAWMIEPFKGNTNIWHNGGTGGFRTWCGYLKDKKLGVVILSNSSADVDDIALELLSFLTSNQVIKGSK
jgi:CubicO group peptidase (beta-lactamase class C family)